MNAVNNGDVSKVVEMVEAGMPVDITDEYGRTALMAAALNRRTDVVRYLLDKGANVNEQDSLGKTALHEASLRNNTDVTRMLLQHGAIKDIEDDVGDTPIDLARWWNQDNEETLDLLEEQY